MPIKLLKKSEIHAIQQREKRDEIEQGKQLASRIDRLREVAVVEEASLKQFREQTIRQIHQEIETENIKLAELRKEISLLDEKRAIGLSDIEFKKSELDKKHDEVNKKIQELTAKLDTIIIREKILEDSVWDAKIREEQAIELKEQAEQALYEALLNKKQAEDEYKTAESIKKQTQSYLERAERELTQREIQIASNERSLNSRTASLEAREKAVGDRERAVQDMYQALLQAQKHLKHD